VLKKTDQPIKPKKQLTEKTEPIEKTE